MKAGKFSDGIVPVTVKENYVDESGKKKSREYIVDADEGPRADTSLDALAKLKPVFAADGSVTAGNSSQTSDGAAFVIVMSEKKVKELNLTPVARLVSYSAAGILQGVLCGYWPCGSGSKSVETGRNEITGYSTYRIE